MPSTIQERQNTIDSIDLLAAQRQLYASAKTYHNWSLIIAGLTAIAFPIAKVLIPDLAAYISLTGAGLALLSVFYLKKQAQDKVNIAARIQEKFDVEVFGLPNTDSAIIGAEASREDIRDAKKAFKDRRTDLKDWYSDTSNAPHQFSVLLSQRSNLVWDWRQRAYYASLLQWSMIALFIISIGIGIWKTPLLIDYLVFIFLPMLTLFRIGILDYQKHQKMYLSQKLKEKEINGVLKKFIQEKEPISTTYLRSVQNTIFENRSEFALVPDMVYGWKKNKFQNDMDAIVDAYIKQLQTQA